MTDCNAQIIDNLLTRDKCFAIYRLPEEEEIHFVMQESGSPVLLYDIEELNDREGFVFAPFRITKECPILLIRPDVTELSDVFNAETKPMAAGKDESYSEADYQQSFEIFLKSLTEGKHEKLVLSRTKSISRSESFSPGRAFMEACRKYIYSYVYLFHTPKSGTWMGSTPEILLSGEGSDWKTIALAGTQFSPSKCVEWDEKNRKEQELVSFYIKERLASIGVIPSVQGPYTVKAGDLVHLRTDFLFSLPDKKAQGSLLKLLHPTPAVSGLPKESAYRFILENEGYDRRYYSGFLGLLNSSGKSDLYVNLRCMSIGKDYLTLFAGGGLLASSTLEEEWKETEYKLRTMLTITK